MNGIDYLHEEELTPDVEEKGWPWWLFVVAGIVFWGALSLCFAVFGV